MGFSIEHWKAAALHTLPLSKPSTAAKVGNNRVQKFDSNGDFITKWGIYGSDDGQFNIPHEIAIDILGNVYVTDPGNARVQVFSPSIQNQINTNNNSNDNIDGNKTTLLPTGHADISDQF